MLRGVVDFRIITKFYVIFRSRSWPIQAYNFRTFYFKSWEKSILHVGLQSRNYSCDVNYPCNSGILFSLVGHILRNFHHVFLCLPRLRLTEEPIWPEWSKVTFKLVTHWCSDHPFPDSLPQVSALHAYLYRNHFSSPSIDKCAVRQVPVNIHHRVFSTSTVRSEEHIPFLSLPIFVLLKYILDFGTVITRFGVHV